MPLKPAVRTATLKMSKGLPSYILLKGRGIHNIKGASINPFGGRTTEATAPLSLLAVQKFNEQGVRIDDTLARWQRSFLGQLAILNKKLAPHDPVLYDYQQEGLNFLYRTRFLSSTGGMRAIFADDLRLGKTVQSLRALTYKSELPLLIVCNKGLMTQWSHEVIKWQQVPAMTKFTYGTMPKRYELLHEVAKNKGIAVTNWATLRKIYQSKDQNVYNLLKRFTSVVVDEAHKAKNRKSQIGEAFRHVNAKNMLALTATPIEKSPAEFFNYMAALYPHLAGSYWRWVSWFCTVQSNGFGNVITGVKNSEILEDFLAPYMLRRTAETANIQMGTKKYNMIYCDTTPAYDKHYKKLAEDVLVEFVDGQLTLEIANELARMTELRKFNAWPPLVGSNREAPKLPVLLDLLYKLGDNPAVIFSSFRMACNVLEGELVRQGYSVTQDSDAWKRGDFQFLLNTPQKGGEGQTYSRADTIIFYDLPLVQIQLNQAKERTNAVGKTQDQQIYALVSAPIDEYLVGLLDDKQHAVKQSITKANLFNFDS